MDDHQLRNSLEALTNLVYLARVNASNPRAALTYLELAEEHLKLIAGTQARAQRASTLEPCYPSAGRETVSAI